MPIALSPEKLKQMNDEQIKELAIEMARHPKTGRIAVSRLAKAISDLRRLQMKYKIRDGDL